MGLYSIDKAVVTDMQTETTSYIAGQEPWQKNIEGFKIDSISTDVSTYQPEFDKWHGFYRTIPEFKAAMDTITNWIVGDKLILGNAKTKAFAKRFRGMGKETMRKFFKNQYKTAKICGDSYAVIIRDKAGRLINLMTKDPGTIRTIANSKGRIIQYQQMVIKGNASTEGKDTEPLHKWRPEEIFHVINNRIADEIHGIPEAESMQTLIKSRHQIQATYAVTLHRYMKPTFFYEADTDDETELATIAAKINKAVKDFENIVVAKGTLGEIKAMKVAQFSILDPIPWMSFLKKYFTQVTRVPDIVQGESRESAISSGELNYISYKAAVIEGQNEYSEDIEMQLGLDIKFPIPREITIEGTNTNAGQRGSKDTVKKGAGNND